MIEGDFLDPIGVLYWIVSMAPRLATAGADASDARI
jgi:hypothetical protein